MRCRWMAPEPRRGGRRASSTGPTLASLAPASARAMPGGFSRRPPRRSWSRASTSFSLSLGGTRSSGRSTPWWPKVRSLWCFCLKGLLGAPNSRSSSRFGKGGNGGLSPERNRRHQHCRRRGRHPRHQRSSLLHFRRLRFGLLDLRRCCGRHLCRRHRLHLRLRRQHRRPPRRRGRRRHRLRQRHRRHLGLRRWQRRPPRRRGRGRHRLRGRHRHHLRLRHHCQPRRRGRGRRRRRQLRRRALRHQLVPAGRS
mmetsp:Transcript_147158/g.470260  ORF Transcript_147158/g.470260 Transcript_147158/m.470260 type:complete len:253 (-) Transcript_147158:975-1733(-)